MATPRPRIDETVQVTGTAPEAFAARRGARRPADVPPAVLRALEAGRPSVNHMEQMALDAGALLAAVLPEAASHAERLRVPRFLDRMRAGADVAWEVFGEAVFDVAAAWESDTARGWAAFAVPRAHGGPQRQLALAARMADDAHFAVREWAWLGVRPVVLAEPLFAISTLAEYTTDLSPRVRRFCSEATRPRGVWSPHIPLLKACPAAGLPVLEPLAAADERYVRDSVGNWLNDVSRTHPGWVRDTCTRWTAEHGEQVRYLCRRAKRGLTGGSDGFGPPPRAPVTSM